MSKSLCEVLKTHERNYIWRVLYRYKGNRRMAAKALGIGLSTLYRKINELDLKLERW